MRHMLRAEALTGNLAGFIVHFCDNCGACFDLGEENARDRSEADDCEGVTEKYKRRHADFEPKQGVADGW